MKESIDHMEMFHQMESTADFFAQYSRKFSLPAFLKSTILIYCF